MNGEELKEFISKNGYTISEFAELAGVSDVAVYKSIRTDSVSKQLVACVKLLKEISALKDEISPNLGEFKPSSDVKIIEEKYKNLNGEDLKEIIKNRGLNYREFGEIIGYKEDAISRAVRTGNISLPMHRAINMLVKIEELEQKASVVDLLAKIITENIGKK